MGKFYKKMTKKDKKRIAKNKEDPSKAMVIKKINKTTGKVQVFLDCIVNRRCGELVVL